MRFNEGKPQLSYILEAKDAITGCAAVLEFGAEKYDRGNWKKGLDKNEIIDSLLRHLTSYLSGAEYDEDSGLHHLDHVTCNALFLADQYNGKRQEAAHQKLVIADAVELAMSKPTFCDRYGRTVCRHT